MAPNLLIRNRKEERKQKRKKGKATLLPSRPTEDDKPRHEGYAQKSTNKEQQYGNRNSSNNSKNKGNSKNVKNSKNSKINDDNNDNKKRPASTTREKDLSETQTKKRLKSNNRSPYTHLDPETALALQRDDAEISELEAKLGLADSKAKKRLHKEYATQEGYGDDFGDFLDDLDKIVERLNSGPEQHGDNDDDDDDDESDEHGSSSSSSLEEEVEIDGSESGEEDVGEEEESHDNEEESPEEEETLEGEGVVDSSSFPSSDEEEGVKMDGSEHVEEDVKEEEEVSSDSDDESVDRDGEEAVPMQPPANEGCGEDESEAESSEVGSDADETGESDGDGSEKKEDEPDHNVNDTYRPSQGEDIYGNTVDQTKQSTKLSKYVPPHLRGKGNVVNKTNTVPDVQDEASEESMKTIRRALNNALNRLSEDTLITVAQSIARLYPSHPTSHVNRCIWENTYNACIARSYLMTGLTPLYTAAIVGVHVQKGDSVQLGEFIIEMTITDLYKKLPVEREKQQTELPDADDVDAASSSSAKEVTNLILLLCYLYNLDVLHCSLMYDVIRDLIKSMKEIDIELLLIILSHCGRSLRSDDPSALKAIVLDVQNRVLARDKARHNSSRVDYMVSAVMDLKNNKRRKQDTGFGEKTAKLRKQIGHIKSTVAASNGNVRSSDSSHRITLKDILEVEEKGRWWRVGASWEGNQHSFNGENDSSMSTKAADAAAEQKAKGAKNDVAQDAEKESQLLSLAAKYRMNTDIRRTIFCIIMGSADFEDAFEKLVKAGMLKSKSERETARVLMECCGNEKSFNNFYAHLAKRICEYQTQSKFTYQLAYWDIFKQMDESMKPRKAANLAKLLFSLVVEHRVLKLSVLKGVDMTSPEDLSEIGMIFLTVFFSNIMDHFDDPSDVTSFFGSGPKNRRIESSENNMEKADHAADETEALYASLTLFFVQVLKSSPKHVKGSKFRANLKAAIKACDSDNFFA